jgi:RHS repeat-associated protein
MRAWSLLRQLLTVTLCAVLVAPAYPSESTLPRSSSTPSHIYDAATLSKTRVWGSNEKILLHFRAVRQLSEKQQWGCEKCSQKNVVGSGVTYDYDAFGNLIHSTGTTPNNYLFAGEQFDPDLGLYYNRARYLNVSTGRFWTMDTFYGDSEAPLSLHKYLYAKADPISRRDPSGHESIAELDISSAISETLDTISSVQKVIRTKDEISSVLDFLSSVIDLGILLGTGGLDGLGLSDLAQKVGSAATNELGRDIVEAPLNLFASITANAPRIAAANLLSPVKDVKLAQAFKAPDSAVLLYLPGFIGSLTREPFSTGLKVAGRPLKITTQGGRSLLGMGFQGGGSDPVQLFHVDLVLPDYPGHSGKGQGGLESWYDGNLNYQVPEN